MQAHACGLAPSVAFNPVLLKPGSDRIVAGGGARAGRRARSARGRTSSARPRCSTSSPRPSPTCGRGTTSSSARAPARPPRSTCGPTTSPTWAWRRPPTCRCVVVGDIDRGGVLAHLFGTVAVLDPADQAPDRRVRDQQVPRRSRAARPRARPAARAHRPPDARRRALGRTGCGSTPRTRCPPSPTGCSAAPAPPRGAQWLRVAVVRLPRISNATDAEALACEPGVAVRYVTEPSRLAGRRPRRAARLASRPWPTWPGCAAPGSPTPSSRTPKAGRPVLGICGGYQMLGRRDRATRTASRAAIGRRARPARPGGRVRRREARWPTRPARRGASRCTATRSTTGGWCAPATRRCSTAEGSDARRRARHPLARAAGERRVPPRAAAPGRRAGRPRPGSWSAPDTVVRRGARPPSSTCSATSSSSTSTPRRWNM